MDSQTHKVVLHMYDLSQGMAKTFSPMFLGKQIDAIWHTGVVIYGKEYYFGGGICGGLPKQTPYGYPIKEMDLGQTEVTQDIFENFLNDISVKYTMETYDLFTNNCNNFTNECVEFLVGKGIPEYITGLPQEFLNTQIGQMVKPMIEQMTNRAVNDSTSQHFGPSGSAGVQIGGNQDQQQQLVNNLANLLSANFNGGIQQPQPQPQASQSQSQVPIVPKVEVQVGESNVVSIEDIEMFTCMTESSPNCVIDFYADWCGPCKNIKPLFASMSIKYKDSVQFYSINIEKAKDIAEQLQVQSIPTFMTYQNGMLKDRWTGGSPQTLEQKVQALSGK